MAGIGVWSLGGVRHEPAASFLVVRDRDPRLGFCVYLPEQARGDEQCHEESSLRRVLLFGVLEQMIGLDI